MQRLLIIIASLVLAGQACADVVLYTDRHHPPLDNDPQVTVVWLDAPDTAQQQIFGNLALEPDKAERQAKVLPQSPNWARQQARIVDARQGVLKARNWTFARCPPWCLTIAMWCTAPRIFSVRRRCAQGAGHEASVCLSTGRAADGGKRRTRIRLADHAPTCRQRRVPDCIDYRVVGVCYWLLCTPFGCSVKTSVKVRHFIPQVVVSAYRQPGDNPWREVAMLSRSALGGLADGGGENQQKRGQRKDNVRYRSVDAIGHPAASLIGQQTSGYSCKGAATAWQPYFLSNLDALMWRTGLPESVYPEALTPGGGKSAQPLPGTCGATSIPVPALSHRRTTIRPLP